MLTLRMRTHTVLAAALAAAALSACSDRSSVTGPGDPDYHVGVDQTVIVPGELTYSISPTLITTALPGDVVICKTGAEATFQLTIFPHLYGPNGEVLTDQNGMPLLGPAVQIPGLTNNVVTLQPGTCIVFHALTPHEFTIISKEFTIIAGQIQTPGNFQSLTAVTINALSNTPLACDPDLLPAGVDLEFCEVSGATVTFGELNIFHGGLATFVNAPPPPKICTFTKGYYRNHPEAVGAINVAGLVLTEAQAEAILEATPGKPNGVSFTSNNLLNLEQQLITAIINLGGDITAGPDEVDAAIATALAEVVESGLSLSAPNLTSDEIGALIDVLSKFNEGKFGGFPHCED
jgi:hypothetical protein